MDSAHPAPTHPTPETATWFTHEVQPHDAHLRAYLRGAFPAVRDLDDVVQESYLRVWRARATHPIQSAKAFLFRVARNIALNRVARDRRSPIAPIVVGEIGSPEVLDGNADAAEHAAREETLSLLAEALASLPPRCREITMLRKLHAVPQREIAARLRLSEKTVEEQAARGVKRCEAYLRARGVTCFLGS